MKKNLICLLGAVGAMFAATSCKDDDTIDNNVGSLLEAKVYTSSENNLSITLNDAAMLGKSAAFAPAANGTAKITLSGEVLQLDEIIGGVMTEQETQPVMALPTAGVIPGSPSLNLDVVLSGDDNKCTFEGAGANDYCNFSYSGAVDAENLAITFKDVKLKDLSVAGTWNVPALVEDNYTDLLHFKWEAERGLALFDPEEEMPIESLVSMVFIIPMFEPDENGDPTMTIPGMLEKALKNVTFGEDGFITARYADSANGFTLTDSPKGVAQYVVADANTLRVYLNPANIIAATQRLAAKSRSFDPSAIIEGLMANVVPMLAAGVPVHFSAVENRTAFYLGTETILPILKLIAPVFEDEEIVSYIVGMIAEDPSMADMAPMIESALKGMPGVIATTSNIEIGLNLEK